MLAYILAIAVGFGSFALYMAAFFFPEVHRKYDFTWSGVGMFYALVLWVCAGRITGGVLLGQFASIALLGWFGWQTLTLRRELTPTNLRTQAADQQTWQAQLYQLQTTLKTRSQTIPLLSTLAPLTDQLTEMISTGRSLVKGVWETSRKSLQKPPQPTRPVITRSPVSEADKAAKAEQRAKARAARLAERAEQAKALESVEEPAGEMGDPNLANPNNSLELLDEDFFADDEVESHKSPETPVVAVTVGSEADELSLDEPITSPEDAPDAPVEPALLDPESGEATATLTESEALSFEPTVEPSSATSLDEITQTEPPELNQNIESMTETQSGEATDQVSAALPPTDLEEPSTPHPIEHPPST